MSGDQQPQPCPACNGDGVTEHVSHSVETDEDGNLLPVEHRWTGQCTSCSGTGEA
ncbi:hypothetical protein [Streptomyces longisporoflavus]|uniref:Small CPxCG-related zinc finger protein n=1 Tax=Streptomyces longisporoflavus TaxID=28044 RepID=A0ABW7R403_9ACTN